MKTTIIICGSILLLTSCQNKHANNQTIFRESTELIAKENHFYSSWYSTPKNLDAQIKDFYVDPSKDTSLQVSSNGTVIHVPKNAFVDLKGQIIYTKVKLSFKEYKNAADIAFSVIPMTFTDNSGEEYNFNSAGMFDIRGTTLGDEIKIADNKFLVIDYHLAKKNADIDFFQLNEKTDKWEQIQEINPDPMLARNEPLNRKKILKEEVKKPIELNQNDKRLISISFDEFKDVPELQPYKNVKFRVSDKSTFFPNEDSCHWFFFDAEDSPIFGEYSITLKGLNRDGNVIVRNYIVEPVFEGEDLEIAAELFKKHYDRAQKSKKIARGSRTANVTFNTSTSEENEFDRIKGTLLGDGISSDPGHTYPDIIRGLQMSTFGVYNCDQIYRVKSTISVLASYVGEDGELIENPSVLSLIDLNYNGAFSFDPQRFTCNSEGDNVLVLYTESGEIYIYDRGKFAGLDLKENSSVIFEMRNVSDEITNSSDLAMYLGLPF